MGGEATIVQRGQTVNGFGCHVYKNQLEHKVVSGFRG